MEVLKKSETSDRTGTNKRLVSKFPLSIFFYDFLLGCFIVSAVDVIVYPLNILSDVPQSAGIASTILFFCINDFLFATSPFIHSYADDSALLISFNLKDILLNNM